MTAKRQAQAGFTLIELMISLVLFSFAIAGVLSVAVSVTQGYREQRGAVSTETAVRVPIDFIADALRQASPSVPTPATVFDMESCHTTGAISVTNSAIAPDELDVVYASGAVVTSTRTSYSATLNTALEVTDVTQLAAGDHILISDLGSGYLVKIDAVDTITNVLTLAAPCVTPTITFSPGSLIIRAQHARFFIADLDGIPTLWMDPDGDRNTTPNDAEPLAEGIEDMQVAVGVNAVPADGELADANSNGDDWHYNVAGDADPVVGSTITAVRVTLIARSSKELAGGGAGTFFRPAAEDRAAASANDSFRRRVLRTTVEMRNIGGSP